MRDIDWSDATTFDWVVELWIPLALGIATVVVAVAAVRASSRAGQLAEKVEMVRIEEESRRVDENRRQRVLDMAQTEARLLWTWFDLELSSFWRFQRPTPEPERDPAIAKRAAQAALAHSFVPGARAMFEITEFDIRNRHADLPADEVDEFGTEHASPEAEAITQTRDERTLGRIHDWALDPFEAAGRVEAELEMTRMQPAFYLASAGR
ncbi:hypothetical protein [Agromyces ramosus]|uniref:Uncharacterized protein n=1 Tax=Agromyces ramosus TaxID=33879 RepID=A0ABU0RBP1_9MICO|nr:hypothetical protein [Agromyces ramosus]MDQ0894444.1 hypothetical protein [Agromyces ramosus]